MLRTRLALVAIALLTSLPAAAGGVRVQGRVVDQGGLALPGVTLTLTPTSGIPPQTGLTGADGAFDFETAPGRHRLDARLDGFDPISLDVQADAPLVLPDLVMRVARFTEETTVVAALPTATEVQPRQFGAPATIAAQVIENAPMRGNRYDDMLPLLPNVVRGPDGLVSVAGARAPQGVVLVNGVPASDVATGVPLAPVPLGAVETVQVVTTGFAAEHGPATGGVTIINSRAGSDAFKFTVNSFTPRPRLADGGIRGIEAWDPNTSLRGPLARGRAWFAQSLDYHFEKTRADTAVGRQDRRQHGFTSFTQLDAKVTPGHILTAWFNGHRQHVDGEGLNAFNPLGSVPVLEHGVWNGAAIDRSAFGTATLETRADVRYQDLSLTPDGDRPYLVGHDVTRGSYFDAVNRHTVSLEAASVFSRLSTGPLGKHLFKAGASAGWRRIEGVERGRPATYLRSSLVPARVVAFVGAGVYDTTSTQVGGFLQDTWEASERLAVDAGFRLDSDGRLGVLAAPRAGVTWRADDRTTLTAGAGVFAGDIPLAALAFDGYQSRQVAIFDAVGTTADLPVVYCNATGALTRARATIWSGRVDRRLATDWQLRTAVQERRGSHEAVITPTLVAGGNAALLASIGESRTRSFEATLGYRPARHVHQLYVSYVRASSRGNTNDFGQVEGLFKDAWLAAPEMAPLPSDVPHRLLAWGLFSLPGQTTVAPFLDVRSGFPYSAIGDDWSYAGPRFARRYPAFASLDVVVNKVVALPGGIRARVGVKLYNVAGRRNGRDVQADVSRPDFGQTYNALGRQVRGVFEIIWSGNRK